MSISDYLKQNRGLHEIVCMMLENYKHYGRLHGNCIVESPPDNLRYLAGRIMGNVLKSSYKEAGPLVFSFNTFFARLKKVNCTNEEIGDMIQEYFGEIIVTRPQIAEKKRADFKDFLSTIAEECHSEIKGRLMADIEAKGRVYITLRSVFNEDRKRALKSWKVIMKMWLWVIGQIDKPAENLKLVMVSDTVTGDPHGLDRTSIYRKLLVYLLALESGKDMPQVFAESEQEFLSEFNIYTDFVSSFISVYNIRDEYKDGTSMWEPFVDNEQLMNITLANVLAAEKIITPGNMLIVENPSVFESLCPAVNNDKFCLMCTHGNLNVAALKLLDCAIKTNPDIKLFYNGDFDFGGITIANRMLYRFGGSVSLIHYDKETYESITSEV
ncbi:MAG: DUF2399 domain-containing protein, partial [Peptostreptococcaceae bacterium]|nr:DUF2399 domain-containing protein [Peptostreptococcaceae bacterium]